MTQEPTVESLDTFARQHAHLIQRMYAQAKGSKWGLPVEAFTETLRRSAEKRFSGPGARADELEGYLKSLHLEDLALACACGEGLDAAWEYFVAQYRQQLYGAARGILQGSHHGDESRARELADTLYAELYGLNSSGNARRKSLFHYFHGRSKLSTWLRAVLAQRHVDQLRTSGRTVSLDSEAEEDRPPAELAERIASPAPNPDRANYLARLDSALSAALMALPSRERLLLSYYYVDQSTLREIGLALGEHESTISRQLERTRRTLREAVAQTLLRGTPRSDGRAAEPAMDQAQVDLAFECALEDWPFDLSKALSGGRAASDAKD